MLLPWVSSVIMDEGSHLKANNKLNLFGIFTKSLSYKGLILLENKTQCYISWKILKSTSFTKATTVFYKHPAFRSRWRGCFSKQTIHTALAVVLVSRYPETLLKFPCCWEGKKRGGGGNQGYEISKFYVYLLVFSSEYSGGVLLRWSLNTKKLIHLDLGHPQTMCSIFRNACCKGKFSVSAKRCIWGLSLCHTYISYSIKKKNKFWA